MCKRKSKVHITSIHAALAVLMSWCLVPALSHARAAVPDALRESGSAICGTEQSHWAGRSEPAARAPAQADTAARPVHRSEPRGTIEAEARSQPPDSIVAYYFHRTYRCERCITMEAYVLAVLHLKHSVELESGALRWHAIDYEDPENISYSEKHQLDGPALVLSHWTGGAETCWTRLDEIWVLLNEPGVLVNWIDRNLEACLGGKCGHGETFYEQR